MAQPETTRGRSEAAVVALAPVVLLAAFALHPWIGAGPPDQSALAEAVVDNPTRWGIAHLATGMSSGLLALAFLAIRARLRAAGPEPWSARGVPLVVMGSALYTLLPGLEFAPLAAAEAGVDVEPVAEALVVWFVPIHVIGALLFGAGVLAFRKGIASSGILSGRTSQLVVGALAVMVVARLVPLVVVQFYVQGVAGVVALCPLAFAMWNAPVQSLVTEQRPAPAT